MFIPRGEFISVTSQRHFFPAFIPAVSISDASFSASVLVFIKAPEPYFTSRSIQSAETANFLLIILEHISGMLSTVPVEFLRAYIFLSAGQRFSFCEIIEKPVLFTIDINSSSDISVRYPSILSSLSIVPPVCPRPLPDILGTYTPHAPTAGPIIRLVLSPTPPVLCLSTVIPFIRLKSRISPLSRIARVSSAVSESVSELRHTAISHADI